MDQMMGGQSMMGQGSNGMDPSQLPMSGPDPEQQAYQQPPQQPDGSGQDNENMKDLVDYALSQANLAKTIRNKKVKNNGKDGSGSAGDTLLLDKIGEDIFKGYDNDEKSRSDWLKMNKLWMDMALLIREEKSFPWPKASNIKYPLLATAAMQFSARAYPALVPSDGKIVKAKVIPYDPDGSLGQKAERVAKHMSYQVMCKLPSWEEEMDKLLMTIAISGIAFKKTFHSTLLDTHVSNIVYPENFVVNYYAKSLETAYRKTEILYYNENEILERINNDEEFLDVMDEIHSAIQPDQMKKPTNGTPPPAVDEATPYTFLSQHTYYDLDNDGYEEPYVITIHKESKKVVRIIARWDSDGVKKDGKGKIVSIKPIEYFTAFPFIPNPDGSIYALGFGVLLGPLNESVNSIVNQLVDAGTLSNMQAGFIGKGLRIKVGGYGFTPGEWKVVNAVGDDLRKQIVPLPVREPSNVLMSLLQMLITSGNQLASIAEIFVGKMPGQNTPATTTQETVKQGMAVFTAIYKRVYRSLHEEFLKLHRLNRITKSVAQEEGEYIGVPITGNDYDDPGLIQPGADPTGDSESTKMQKIQSVGQMLQMGTIDPMAFTQWSLQAMEVPNYQKLLAKPQPPKPDPEAQKMQMEMQIAQQKAQSDQQLTAQKLQVQQNLAELQIQVEQAKLELQKTKAAIDIQTTQAKAQNDQVMQAQQMKMDQEQMQHDAMVAQVKSQMDLQATQAQTQMQVDTAKTLHKQKIQQGAESFKQKQAQAKATAKKPKQ